MGLDSTLLTYERHIEELLALANVLEPGEQPALKVIPLQVVFVNRGHGYIIPYKF